MAIDLTKILNVIQEKVGSANSTNISTQDMINLADAAKKINAGHVIESYANTDVFPTASTSSKRIAFDELNRTLYLNNGSEWKQYDLTVPDAASSSSGSHFPGSNYGYTSGGYLLPNHYNIIDKFPFATDADATDVGDLSTSNRYQVTGQSSAENGYTSGGRIAYNTASWNTIDKFPFATDGNATDIANLTQSRYTAAAQSSSDYGYTSGGGSPSALNIIDKFPFATNADATDVGDLTAARSGAGQSSSDYGYTSGGNGLNVIDKFPFAADANATDVGDLTEGRGSLAGQSSAEYGYVSGNASTNVIEKFPFATDANATDVGDLTLARNQPAGQSSTEYGYSSGGGPHYPTAGKNTIDKFPFAADANATDVGNLTAGRWLSAGHQY
jgi:hypothetical protein